MATISWTGAAGDGNYNNPNNWSPQQVPTTADAVKIPAGSGVINAGNGAAGGLTVGKGDTLSVPNNTAFTIGVAKTNATVNSAGTIALGAGGNNTDLIIAAKQASLQGGGTITLSDDPHNRIYGASGTDILNNAAGTIIGAGQLGLGELTLVNGTAGRIIASGSNALVLNTGTAVTTNSGLIEALSGGGLVLNSVIDNGSTGTIAAAGANFQLQGGTIRGGTLTSSGTSTILDNGGGTLDGSTSPVVNDGTVNVVNNNTLGVLGTITNVGQINLQAGGNNTDLVVQSPTVTLGGGGTIALSDDSHNRIYAAGTANLLDNVDNTIEGSGQLGAAAALGLVNEAAGRILSTGGNALVINTGTAVTTNSGLIEALSGGGIVLNSVIDNGATGTIGTIAAAGPNFQLQGGVLRGGTLETSNGGAILDNGGGTLDGSASTVVNDGLVAIANNNTLDLLGTLHNVGTVALQSGGNNTDLVAASSTVTLNGGGTVTLSDDSHNRIYGASASDVLDNVDNTIVGAGEIGVQQLTFVNHATVDANGGNQLRIDTANIVINDALMEATGTGGLWIENNTTIDGSGGGTLYGNGGTVYLYGGNVVGGTFETGNGGAIVDNGGATLDGSTHTVVNDGLLAVANNNTLDLLGTFDNVGTLALQSGGNNTDLVAASSTVTLNGGGTVTLSDDSHNRIYGASASDVLDNVDNTIAGAGEIGAQQLTFVNHATIDANGGNQLRIDTANTVTNDGLMESTGPGGLWIEDNTTIDGSGGGTLYANGGTIYLDGGNVAGGTLETGSGDTIVDNGGATFDGSSHMVVNDGLVAIANNNTLDLLGTFDNVGTVALQSGGNYTDLIAASPTVTLTGGGTITLSDDSHNRIYGASGSDVLLNRNNTIIGAGQLGAGQLTLVNATAGTIAASGGNALVLNTGGVATTNAGLLEALSGAGLVLQSAVNNGTSGRISAAGANVQLQGGDIIGGTLTGSGGGVFVDNGGGTLDGQTHPVVNHAAIDVQNNNTLTLLGSIANAGTIALQSGGNYTDLILASPTVTLTGGGTVALSDDIHNRIYGTSSASVLNNVNDTIEGAGQLGVALLTINNSGTIEQIGGNELHVDPGSKLRNTGAMIGAGSGGLNLYDGTYTNAGLFEALNGSQLAFEGGATLTNNANGVLNGGSYAAISTGGGATIALAGAAITTDAASITLDGAASTLTAGGTLLETSLALISATGTLAILDGRSFTAAKALTDRGVITLSGTLGAKSLAITSTGQLDGNGTLVPRFNDAGTIDVTGGALTLAAGGIISGPVNGTGTLVLAGGATTLAAGASLALPEVALINKAALDLGAPISFLGTLDLAGTNLVGGAAFTNGGLIEQTGTTTGRFNAAVDNTNGTIDVASGHLLFTAGVSGGGTIIDNAALSVSSNLTGGTLEIGAAGSAASIATATGAGNSTLAVLDKGTGTLNTNGTTVTVTSDYHNTASGAGNAYDPFKGVTGTIDGQGTEMTLVGVRGTTITTVNGTPTITLAAGQTAYFEVENAGTAGSAALRGALQTTVNGGNITSSALSGTGIRASNFGPITAGDTSAVYSIHYSGGGLSNQSIHFESDFANVGGITLNVQSSGTMAAAVAPAALPDHMSGSAADFIVPLHN